MSWQNLIDGNPELAAYGDNPLDGSCRLSGDGAQGWRADRCIRSARQFCATIACSFSCIPTSPKAHDLQRDGHYALHCAVEDREGGQGEFYIRGKAQQNFNADDWELVRPSHADEFNVKYILFELSVEQAFSMVYVGDGDVKNRWKQADR